MGPFTLTGVKIERNKNKGKKKYDNLIAAASKLHSSHDKLNTQ